MQPKIGEMPEWSNGAVSKTVELLVGSGGSNPPLSAEDEEKKSCRVHSNSFFFLHLLQSPPQAGGDVRPKGANPPERGIADAAGLVLPPSKPSPRTFPPGEGLAASYY